MSDIVGSDIPQGQEVKWYYGGVMYTQTISNCSSSAQTLTKTADVGSVIATLNGVPAAVTEFKTDGTTPADETTGTVKVKIAGATGTQTAVLYYLDIQTTGLTHIASCLDVKKGASASSKTNAVHGQATKLVSVGALECTVDLEQFYYTTDFIAAVMGDEVSNSPASGKKKWSNVATGVRKLGALVGKRFDSDGAVVYKWFLFGAQCSGLDSSFPTEDLYKNSIKFGADFFVEAKVVAS
jgi:hypothetical protein